MLQKKTLANQLIDFRHYFHQHPELANSEFNTTNKIKEILKSWGIKILPSQLKTGVFAEIGKKAGPILALRADIDALPIKEKTGLSYSSKNKGIMHACGHDIHIVSLLGASYLLKQKENELPGRIRLIFQLAEEDKEGALQVIKDGKLEGVQAILGFHNRPGILGEIGLRSGIVSGAIDKFKVNLIGTGSHASAPQKGKDAIAALGAEINSLQSIISRNLDPFQAAVLSITHVNAGNTWNILPEKAFFEGTVRTANLNVRHLIRQRFLKIVKSIASAYGVKTDISWYKGDPSVNNDEYLTKVVRDETRKYFKIYRQNSGLGSDDFACFQEKVPGVYANIGNGERVNAHRPDFKADDKTIIYGTKFFEKNAFRILRELNKTKFNFIKQEKTFG